MRYLNLALALLLCAAASSSLTLDVPWRVSLVVVGAFMLFTPGLLVTYLLRLPDLLLTTVVGLVVGPSLWVLIGTLQLFAGWWAPRPTILVATGIMGVATMLLAAAAVGYESDDPATRRPSLDSVLRR